MKDEQIDRTTTTTTTTTMTTTPPPTTTKKKEKEEEQEEEEEEEEEEEKKELDVKWYGKLIPGRLRLVPSQEYELRCNFIANKGGRNEPTLAGEVELPHAHRLLPARRRPDDYFPGESFYGPPRRLARKRTFPPVLLPPSPSLPLARVVCRPRYVHKTGNGSVSHSV
ncbi:hypothetical protein E2C01_058039 [Portunus trituberculatus]|uniref:Uncharacterized protein n=1 Tax=Portunus trituberculatus TaxID=210409 RepID=A0A5B7GUJ3_PORTR|nr:hypothetical protein [Portunus trituberculatus]